MNKGFVKQDMWYAAWRGRAARPAEHEASFQPSAGHAFSIGHAGGAPRNRTVRQGMMDQRDKYDIDMLVDIADSTNAPR